jgi:hypothetical protein
MADQYECEYGSLWVGTIRVAEEMDESSSTTTERELTQEDSLVETEEEVAGSGERDLGTRQPGGGAAGVESTACGPPRRPPGGRGRPPRLGRGRPGEVQGGPGSYIRPAMGDGQVQRLAQATAER